MNFEEIQKNLFVSECIRLETFIRMYSSTYSAREAVSVFCKLIKEYCEDSENPKEAIKQVIEELEKRNENHET